MTGTPPRNWLISGTWPDGKLHPDAPRRAVAARQAARLIGELMVRANMTPEELAARTGLHPTTVTRMLAGDRKPSGTTVALMLNELAEHWVLASEAENARQPIPKDGLS